MLVAERERLFTAIARCTDCKHELNRAEHVPEREQTRIILSAPLVVGRCPKGCRSTFSDCNLNFDLEWIEEPAEGTAPHER